MRLRVDLRGIGFWLLCTVWLMGCGPTLKLARQQEKQGKQDLALHTYRQIAKKEGSEEARRAQIAVVKLLLKRESWKPLSVEVSRLNSFLDADGPWYQRYHSQKTIWEQGFQEIKKVLLDGARFTFKKARRLGDPNAYIAAGKMYGLFVERFGKSKERAEAAAGRGVAFAVRGDCSGALRWFQRALQWSPGLRATPNTRTYLKDPQLNSPPEVLSQWLKWQAVRGDLGCRLRLWLEAKAHGDDKKKSAYADFATAEQAARAFVHRAPYLGGQDLLRHTLLLERAGAFLAALRLLVVIIDDNRSPRMYIVAKQRALQVFGKTNRWKPLLAVLVPKLAKIPFGKRDIFWKRVQYLSNLYSARKAQSMAQHKQGKAAVHELLKKYRQAPQQRQMLLYRAALIYELNLKQFSQALQLYGELITKHPKHPTVGKALYRSAQLFEKNKQLREAIRYYVRLGRFQPKHPIAPRSYFQAYMLQRKLGRRRSARRLRRLILRRYPTSLAAARLVKMRRRERRRRRRRRR